MNRQIPQYGPIIQKTQMTGSVKALILILVIGACVVLGFGLASVARHANGSCTTQPGHSEGYQSTNIPKHGTIMPTHVPFDWLDDRLEDDIDDIISQKMATKKPTHDAPNKPTGGGDKAHDSSSGGGKAHDSGGGGGGSGDDSGGAGDATQITVDALNYIFSKNGKLQNAFGDTSAAFKAADSGSNLVKYANNIATQIKDGGGGVMVSAERAVCHPGPGKQAVCGTNTAIINTQSGVANKIYQSLANFLAEAQLVTSGAPSNTIATTLSNAQKADHLALLLWKNGQQTIATKVIGNVVAIVFDSAVTIGAEPTTDLTSAMNRIPGEMGVMFCGGGSCKSNAPHKKYNFPAGSFGPNQKTPITGENTNIS